VITALFDMDDTLVDCTGGIVESLNQIAAPGEEVNLRVFGTKLPRHIKKRVDLIFRQQGWWRALKRLELGFDILKAAREVGFTPHILTKGPSSKPQAWKEKLEWIRNEDELKGVQTTITEDKGLVYGRVLVDDWPGYMNRWLKWRTRGLGIMIAYPQNEKYSHPNVIKCDGTNMDEIRRALQLAHDRETGQSVDYH